MGHAHQHDHGVGLGGQGIAANTGFAYQSGGYQPQLANQFGVQDPILQDQPLLPQAPYGVKRDNGQKQPASVGQDNPFLRHRHPKSITVTMKRLDGDYGRQGWVPIPYPLYR